MTVTRRGAWVVWLGVLLSGCVAQGPVYQPAAAPDPDAAIIYVYRENTFFLSARSAYFSINDVNVFDLNADGYSWVAVPAGTYKVSQKWPFDILKGPIAMDITVQAREKKFLSFETARCESGGMERCVSWTMREERPALGAARILDKKFQPNFGADKLHQTLGKPPG